MKWNAVVEIGRKFIIPFISHIRASSSQVGGEEKLMMIIITLLSLT